MLDLLRVFIKVAEKGNFSRVAQDLGQPTSRVSRTVTRLEENLGVTLFYRTTRQLSLTDAGKDLYQRTQTQMTDLENALRNTHESSATVSGWLKITALEDMGPMLASPCMAFKRLHPKIRIQFHFSTDLVDLVKNGLDLAIRVGLPADANLKSLKLGSVAMILVASPHYLKARGKSLKLSELHQEAILSFVPDGSAELQVWKLRKKSGGGKFTTIQFTPEYISNSAHTISKLAREGAGIGLIPDFLCTDWIKSGALQRVLPEYESQAAPIYALWHSHAQENPNVRAFLDFAMPLIQNYFLSSG